MPDSLLDGPIVHPRDPNVSTSYLFRDPAMVSRNAPYFSHIALLFILRPLHAANPEIRRIQVRENTIDYLLDLQED